MVEYYGEYDGLTFPIEPIILPFHECPVCASEVHGGKWDDKTLCEGCKSARDKEARDE